MGGVCTPNSFDKCLVECPHHKKRKKGDKLPQIKAEIVEK